MPNTHQTFADGINFSNPALDTGIVVTALVAIIAAILICQLAINIWQTYLRPRAKRIFANLRSLPHTDEESFRAVELLLQGVVLCVLGQVFPILVLFGVVPLYYGARKLGWVILRIRQREPDGLRR